MVKGFYPTPLKSIASVKHAKKLSLQYYDSCNKLHSVAQRRSCSSIAKIFEVEEPNSFCLNSIEYFSPLGVVYSPTSTVVGYQRINNHYYNL